MEIVASDHALKRWRERIAIYGDETIIDIRRRIGKALEVAVERGLQFIDYQNMRILLENRGSLIVIVTVIDKNERKVSPVVQTSVRMTTDNLKEIAAKETCEKYKRENLDISYAKKEYDRLCRLKKMRNHKDNVDMLALQMYLTDRKKPSLPKLTGSGCTPEKFMVEHDYWLKKCPKLTKRQRFMKWLTSPFRFFALREGKITHKS